MPTQKFHTVAIHSNPRTPWQKRYGMALVEGFKHHGLDAWTTPSTRDVGADIAVVLGPNYWKGVQNDRATTGNPYLTVNRCYFGDYNDNVAIGWNGLNGRADFCNDDVDGERWEQYGPGLMPWRHMENAKYIVICGQARADSPHYASVQDWYNKVIPEAEGLWPEHELIFQPHPTGCNITRMIRTGNPAPKEIVLAITLNSTVAAKLIMQGVPVVAMDEGNPAYDVASYGPGNVRIGGDRIPWAHKLAWTQWHISEVINGRFYERLQAGPKNSPRPAFEG